jgi:hypothetical protein
MLSVALLLLLSAADSAPDTPPPMPDIPALLHAVEAHQQELDRAREDYTFHETDKLTLVDKNGKVRSTEEKEYNDFFVRGHEIQTLISKNGKPLNARDEKKEQDRAAKEAGKFATQPEGTPDKDDVSVSRLLQIVTFSNPRRVTLDGRPAIAVDFVGNPKAKTHGRNEDAIKRVAGTVWIDDSAREVARMDATFDDNLHLGFGVLATLEKGSHFSFNQALIRNEAWLPTSVDGHFDGKALMFMGFHVNLAIHFDDYRKFSATARQAPGATAVPQDE